MNMRPITDVIAITLLDGNRLVPSKECVFKHIDQWGVRIWQKTETGSVESTVRWSEMMNLYLSLGTVRLTERGLHRVLLGTVGQELHVIERDLGINGDGVLVYDTRNSALWSLGRDEYEEVEPVGVS